MSELEHYGGNLRRFRLDKDNWAQFRATNDNASETLRQFVMWWNRVPGVEMPERPPARQETAACP